MTRITIAVLCLLAVYGLIEAWPLIAGPRLTVTAPANYATVEGGILNVTGHVERASLFTLNGAALLYDQNGDFSSTLTFPRGGSILTFMVTDRFGRTISETRTIYVP